MSNRKKRRTHKLFKKDPNFYINIAVILFFLALIAVLLKIFIFNNEPTIEEVKKVVPEVVKTETPEEAHHKYEEKTKALEIDYVDDEPVAKEAKEVQKQTESPEKKFSFFDDKEKVETKTLPETKQNVETSKPKIEADKVIQKKETEKEKKVITEKVSKEKYPEVEKETTKQTIPQQAIVQKESGLAKLVIIIDDVSTKKHIQKIQEIGYPITMAFMPPTKVHKDSASIAQGLNSYMVHLPLEATSRSAEESDTLHVGDDLATIEKRIKQLKGLYPKAIYYNNHTGSKFTADEQSMDMLIRVLKNNNIQFVDSRTTPKSVVKQYAGKYGMRYIGRNIFLDNTPTKQAIKIQLQKAVEIAKKTGIAIAIGHPYGATFEALKESKEILRGIDVVTIDKI